MKNISTNRQRILPAEWAEQDAVQLTFPHADSDWGPVLDEVMPCFVAIARAISRFQKVLIVCRNQAGIQPLLTGIPPERLLFFEADSNDTWARDHGGITVFDQGKPLVIDFFFNGWGLKFPADKDNLITGKLCRSGYFSADCIPGGITLEGGAIDSDGEGTLLTTAECLLSLNRNPHLSEQQIEEHLKNLFGLERILWLRNGYLAGDDTDAHVDTLARFCDPQTIAYARCSDQGDEHYAALHAMEAELQLFRTASGQSYRLVPLPWPDACFDAEGNRLPATYANFLIINGAVLAPTYGVPQDREALETLQALFPDREIIGIDCRMLIEQHGSLHCVTMQYPIHTLKI